MAKIKFTDLSLEEQTAFIKIAEAKNVEKQTGRCNDKPLSDLANSVEAREKRIQRMYKQAKEQIDIDNENRLSLLPNFAQFQTEDMKEQIEAFQSELRHRRKKYVFPENKNESEELRFRRACFSPNDIKVLHRLIKLYRNDSFRYYAFALIVEGLKYPQKEIKSLCYQYFKSTLQEGFVDIGIIMMILTKEYVPKGVWRLMIIFQSYFLDTRKILKPFIIKHSEDERTRKNWEKIKNEVEIVKLFPNEKDRDIMELYCK